MRFMVAFQDTNNRWHNYLMPELGTYSNMCRYASQHVFDFTDYSGTIWSPSIQVVLL